MTEEEKRALADNSDANQNQTEAEKILAESQAENARIQAELDTANDDVKRYQSEADIAKSKLDKDEQLNVREEGLTKREHNSNLADIRRDFPDVFKSFPDAFDSLEGSDKDDYVNQAKYLQEGINKHKTVNTENVITDEDKKKNEDEANKNKETAPLLPDSNQNNGNAHTFTKAELKEHAGDQEWYRANEQSINDQLAKGLIR